MQTKTRIVATLGPASEKKDILKQMIKNGMRIARLNFSHGSYIWHRKAIKNIRELAKELNVNIGILGDLQGPRIRVQIAEDLKIERGEKILVVDGSQKKTFQRFDRPFFFLDYPHIIKNIRKDSEILIEDGLISLKVLENRKEYLVTKVINGGIIRNHKGVNIPGVDLNIDVITQKDKKDLDFILKEKLDFIALSFVSSSEDIQYLKQLIFKKTKKRENVPWIIAKIERQQAITNLGEILDEADGVMVARGDLGIEMDENKLAVLQKRIIAESLKRAKPVIVATQMLDSMIRNPRPTRAEVSDVSNAVIDHTDAVMLSGESASGKYPVESVSTMQKIIYSTEKSIWDDEKVKPLSIKLQSEYSVLARSAYELAESFSAKAIVVISLSGFTARLISHFRPQQKILVATNRRKTFHYFSLLWGVEAYLFKKKEKLDLLIDKTIKLALKEKLLKEGDKVVVLIGRNIKGKKMRLVGVKYI